MLIHLMNGNWIDHRQVSGLRVMTDNKPRVVIDTPNSLGLYIFDFDSVENARAWAQQCAQRIQATEEKAYQRKLAAKQELNV